MKCDTGVIMRNGRVRVLVLCTFLTSASALVLADPLREFVPDAGLRTSAGLSPKQQTSTPATTFGSHSFAFPPPTGIFFDYNQFIYSVPNACSNHASSSFPCPCSRDQTSPKSAPCLVSEVGSTALERKTISCQGQSSPVAEGEEWSKGLQERRTARPTG